MENTWKIYWKIIAITTLSMSAVYLLVPALNDAFTEEDMLIEVGTVFLYTLALFASIQIVRHASHFYTRAVGAILGLVAFTFILDETSFGRSLVYRYDRPHFFDTYIDSLHDIISVITKGIFTYQSLPMIALTVFCALAAALACFVIYKMYTKETREFVTSRTMIFLALMLGWLILATMIDSVVKIEAFEHSSGSYFTFLEEVFEFLGAFTLFYGAHDFMRTHFTRPTEKKH